MNPPQTPPGDEGDPSSKRDSDNNPEAIPPESQALMKAVKAMGKATENHDVAGAIQSVGQLFALVMADPSKYARAPDGIRERAWACQARGDVAGAEAAWREVIALEEQTGEARFIAKAHLDMGTFLMQTDQDDRALAHSEGVVAAARRTDLEILVWHALEQRTCCALRLGRFRLALETAEEGSGRRRATSCWHGTMPGRGSCGRPAVSSWASTRKRWKISRPAAPWRWKTRWPSCFPAFAGG